MQRDLEQVALQNYDLLIIGGGINGAALANLAILNGLKVILLEKNDFASGTSSKSTKLIHGGLRYLENFEFDLVSEALRERYLLLKSAPHLIKPLSFIIPVYQNDRRPLWMMKLGVWLYDFLCGKYKIGSHQSLTKEEIKKKIPTIDDKNLVGGVLYHDAQMDDSRLVLENILNAKSNGAQVFNYVEVKFFIKEGNKCVGVVADDKITNKEYKIKAKHIVCCAGPWTDQILDHEHDQTKDRVRTTKGIHIVYRGEFSKNAMLIPTQNDKRIFFIIPWMGNSLIGTTDTDYRKNPDSVSVEQSDVDYLFKEIKRVFPKINFSKENIITTFAGLRPLVYRCGSPSSVSRKHEIDVSDSGVIYVMGGKYTTFRLIAQDCLRKILNKPLKSTDQYFPLYGGGEVKDGIGVVSRDYSVSAELIEYLIEVYGTRYKEILNLVKKNNKLKEPLCSCSLAIKAQVVYAIEVEMSIKEQDIISRRLNLIYRDCQNHSCYEQVRIILNSYGKA